MPFGVFSVIILLLAIFGGLNKSGYNPVVVRFLNIPVTKATCQPAIESWFGLFVFGCPAAFFITIITLIKSRGHQNLHHYSFDAFFKEYLIYTNDNRAVNWTVIAIDIIHILWSIAGSILSSVVDHVTGGAISDCAYEYGFFTPLIALTCLIMGYVCILRMLVFGAHFVWHREVMGYVER